MDSGLITGRYAKALFLSALDIGEEERVYQDMQWVSCLLKDQPIIVLYLSGPTLSKSEKKQLMASLGNFVSPHTLHFLTFLVDKKRESKLLPLALLYIEMFRKHKNITTVGIETPVALDDKLERKIMEMVSDKTHGEVEVLNRVKPELLGGYVVYIDDYRLDKSMATELKRIKKGINSQ